MKENEVWIALKDKKPEVLDVWVRLWDGSVIRALSQLDGDFWSEQLQKLLDERHVSHWKPEVEEVISSEPTQGWIKCSDSLPTERFTACLVFNGDAPHYNQHVFEASYFLQIASFKTGHAYMGTITHWMPLPKPPKP